MYLMSVEPHILRQELGDFGSIIFLKAILTGIEETLGERTAAIAMIAAGRKQGKNSIEELGLVNKGVALSIDEIREKANYILGKEGNRLCIIDKIEQEGKAYRVYAKETFCSSGEPNNSTRLCTYTLGAIQGFLEALLGKRLQGKQIGSVLRGSTHDVLEYVILD
jgi:predicted hydrocarbon binding protein